MTPPVLTPELRAEMRAARNEELAAALERALEIARRNEASPDLDHAARVLEENRRGKAVG